MNQETYEQINWIDINLPWHVSCSWEAGPTLPNLSDREREVFGLSLEDSLAANKDHLEAYGRLQDLLRSLQQKTYYGSLEYQKIESDFWIEHQQDPCVIARNDHQALAEKIHAWSDKQPEWEAYERAREEFFIAEKQKSFSGRGLAKPGTLIEMEDGSIELIGSINASGGCCNDCPAFEDSAVIKRYAMVYPFVRRRTNDETE